MANVCYFLISCSQVWLVDYYSDSYEKAVEDVKQAEDTNTIESEIGKKRKAQRPVRFQNSDQDGMVLQNFNIADFGFKLCGPHAFA